MRVRPVLLATLLATTWLTSACNNSSDRIAAPSPVSPTDPAASSQSSGSCEASSAQFAVGQSASDALLERARVAAGATTARFLRPNQPITMEYSRSRLNLGLNEQDVVRAVNCG